jgi:hypothetical protein
MNPSRRKLVILMLAGATVAICLYAYDATCGVRWSGSKDLTLAVEAPNPVRSVSGCCGGESIVEHYRQLPTQFWESALSGDGRSRSRNLDGSFVLTVPTYGRESGLRIRHNTYGQMTDVVLAIELESGERWGAILELPDVRTANSVTLRIPADAHRIGAEVAPAPRPTVR